MGQFVMDFPFILMSLLYTSSCKVTGSCRLITRFVYEGNLLYSKILGKLFFIFLKLSKNDFKLTEVTKVAHGGPMHPSRGFL